MEVPTGTPCRGARIVGQLHERCARRYVRALSFDMVGEYGRAQYQDEISSVEALDDLRAIRGQEAGEQRMLFRKTIASRHGAHPDRGSMPLGECNGLIPGIIARHRCADHDDRPPGQR